MLFQSTPAWGGRPTEVVSYVRFRPFQSTPAWGGRRRDSGNWSKGKSFNPRPRGAGDASGLPEAVIADRFQSTPAWGGRPRRIDFFTVSHGFQSTPAWGGRQFHPTQKPVALMVSIHARVGRATRGGIPAGRAVAVSIHARVGRATEIEEMSAPRRKFQSTPAWGGRHVVNMTLANVDKFQSTPAWGGRPTSGRRTSWRACVSIHARVGRATDRDLDFGRQTIVSIHARVGRATVLGDVVAGGEVVSIHARVGRATEGPTSAGGRCYVSIHARVGRATSGGLTSDQATQLFQSTPAWGGRRVSFPSLAFTVPCFNPRPRGAGDAPQVRALSTDGGFNPRPRGAGDVPPAPSRFLLLVSIHARVGRATHDVRCRVDGLLRFNPRPRGAGDKSRFVSTISSAVCFNPRPRGAGDSTFCRTTSSTHSFNPRPRGAGDQRVNQQNATIQLFQSTPAWGGRQQGRNLRLDFGVQFQSTPAWGGRRFTVSIVTPTCTVSIHARVGRATSQTEATW